MNIQYQRPGIDVDGVLADLFTPWCEYIAERFEIDFEVDNWLSWSEPEELDLVGWKDFLLPGCYSLVDPYPGAVEAVARLREAISGPIRFTTAIAAGTKGEKLDWLKGHGFFQPGDLYCPGHNKNRWNIDILVDDGFHNVAAADCPAILITRPWNEVDPWGWRADSIDHAVDQILLEDKYAYCW